MNYKAYIYVITLLTSIFGLSSINFDHLIRANKIKEQRVLIIMLGLAISYLVTNFITDFISLSSFIKG